MLMFDLYPLQTSKFPMTSFFMTSFFMTSLLCQVFVCMHNNFFMTSFFLTRLNVFAAMMLIQSVYYTASKRTISIGSIYFDKYSLLTVQTTSF